ncbi:MAG TPA: PhoH family protein [Myxococcota bacterium]|nr:PhoH family protein [Myxococcota bacterium]
MTMDNGKVSIQQNIQFDDLNAFMGLCGQGDENVRRLENILGIVIRIRGNVVSLYGEDHEVKTAIQVLRQLYELVRQGTAIAPEDMDRSASVLQADPGADLADVLASGVTIGGIGSPVRPRTPAQKAYIKALREHDLVISIGPAGTGKTYLAMATALAALQARQVKSIVLTRPAVEAGERLGFLPGDLAEKVNPYLRPLYDALYDIMENDRGQKLIDRGVIEIAPLAFMRGRTLSNSFIILDEAQNCSVDQMKMFLTRLGCSSRAVVTGDLTQTDLPPGTRSGLEHAVEVLANVPGIAISRFTDADVMRHPLVRRIIRAWDAPEADNARTDL